MKNIVFICLLILTAAASCNKNDSGEDKFSFEWLVGAENDEVIKEIAVPAKTELEIKLEDSSLCPSNGILLSLEKEGELLFEETISTFPYEEEFNIESSGNLKVKTKVVSLPNEVVCVWLGNVKAVVSN